MAQVRLERLRKSFGDNVVVDDLDLTIADQEFLTLVGPSGCGKSTTLRMICGLEKLGSGEVYFDSEPVGYLPANKRDVSMVFQSYALYPHKTVEQNIGFALQMMRVPKSEIGERVRKTAASLGIENLLGRKPRELSGGQRQRVALGRAIVRDAGAYLLDEPLSNLDAQLRGDMRVELKRLHADLARTFIYVTHDQVEAMTMSDRIAVMQGGVLQQCAPPEEIYGKPANMFVAQFMGSPPMNFFTGGLTDVEGRRTFRSPAAVLALTEEASRAAEDFPAGEVVLGIRPEDVILGEPGDADAADSLQGTVFVAEPLGADVLVTVDLGGELIKARVPAPFRVGIDKAVPVRLRADRAHLFAKESGASLFSPSQWAPQPTPIAPASDRPTDS
ncbi:ABC transporter ATP-binding protein [Actinoalloteichus hymeniacidonis]|uniref:Carbohydrate ABC transporter ATP-binding protein, CUT1 family n=1 Tax=Actinoalloteichus hymeniacidonis TaxID=340345 RepID=A0AAC9MZL2_9PSEU|nr:ABC transporter ATP-binding protein [Actinoalloteichus hymeniacidonis]AOS64187.1 carbohydrate ABC transporter ATP-binding protein, CUT1 family [Actinoalloteichus hymeniacidonis]MBB5907745.1 multiple sugar transport system ATP-binding protein [Actinoalloteichus hymeniacidonis]